MVLISSLITQHCCLFGLLRNRKTLELLGCGWLIPMSMMLMDLSSQGSSTASTSYSSNNFQCFSFSSFLQYGVQWTYCVYWSLRAIYIIHIIPFKETMSRDFRPYFRFKQKLYLGPAKIFAKKVCPCSRWLRCWLRLWLHGQALLAWGNPHFHIF